ncbi:DEKNAAC105310 [Brettanomyces naardenensis]|uniref:Heat shock transcription factor n=1 Tax=Brettanomyces naardenensis TaxID=13370 RepID=A0A448YT89_BRENA|nr:DEKNAAC105310 [Brettanomyces naardenensis]
MAKPTSDNTGDLSDSNLATPQLLDIIGQSDPTGSGLQPEPFPGEVDSILQPIITTPSSVMTNPESKPLNPDPSDLSFYNSDGTNSSYTLSKGGAKVEKAKGTAAGHIHQQHSRQSSHTSSRSAVNNGEQIISRPPESSSSNVLYSVPDHAKSLAVRKQKGKKNGSAPVKRPAFVMKLWNMVNDLSNSKYISWMSDGTAFQVSDRENFMKYVLPKYFKHNNFASFVRQLNMYGWHKIQDVNSGSLMQGDEVWQFENPNFVRDREDLLDNIVRNKPAKETEDEDLDINSLLSQLEAMRKSQKMIEDDLRRVRQDNEMLWKENYMARERHKAQSETLDKILRFLATVYGNNSTKFLENIGAVGNGSDALDFAGKGSPAIQSQGLYDYRYGEPQYRPSGSPTTARQRLLITNKAYSPQELSSNSQSTDTSHIQEIQEIPRGPENRNSDPFLSSAQYNASQSPQFAAASPSRYFPELSVGTPQIRYQPLSGDFGTGLTPNQSPQSHPVQQAEPIQPIQPVPIQPLQSAQPVQPASPSQQVQRPHSSSISSNPEELMGNIHSQLNRNQGTLKQVNEWISKLSGKPSEEIMGPQDDLNDLLLPQSFDLNNGSTENAELANNRINELYDEIEGDLQAAGTVNTPVQGSRKRQNSKSDGLENQRKRKE